MEEWKEYKLGDCVEAVIDNRGKSAPTKPSGEFPLLEINSIGGYYPNYSVIRKYVDKVTYNTWFRSGHPICGDILIPTVGTIGIISIMDNHKACIAQNLIALRTKKEISNIFIYYFLKSPIVKKQLINLDIGGVQPSIKVPHLLNLSISLPEKDIQHKIASILSSLDDKIEVNRKINENLEQQAQALFKSWFVDFEPFKNGEFVESELGMIPKGWRVYKLSEFLPVITGKKDANVAKGGNYPFFSCSQDYGWTDSYSFEGNAILVAGNGDFNVKMYNGKFEAYQRTYVLIPYNPLYTAWLFYAVKFHLDEITSAARGSVIKFITKGNLAEFQFAAPAQLDALNIIIKFDSIRRMIATNNYQSRRLAELRDTLLPKLMSGELKVTNMNLVNEMLEKGIR